MTRRNFIIGTRSSALAIRQTEEVVALLRTLDDAHFTIATITTTGDRQAEAPLLGIGRNVFAKEIEEALIRTEIDVAVHSLKDLLTELPPGLALGAIGRRQDPRDVLVDRWRLPLGELSSGTRIGTSSPRRGAFLRALRPDLRVVPIRGNVDTRLRKAYGEDYDGVILAAAGVIRMGRQEEVAQYLPVEDFVPAVGQGALAVQIRSDDAVAREVVSKADHAPTRIAVTAERAFLSALGGGCAVPVAAYGVARGEELHLVAMAGTEDGKEMFKVALDTDVSSPERAGSRLAERLLASGARDILETAS